MYVFQNSSVNIYDSELVLFARIVVSGFVITEFYWRKF